MPQNIATLGIKVEVDGTDKAQRSLRNVGQSAEQAGGRFQKFGTGLRRVSGLVAPFAAALAGIGFAAMIRNSSQVIDNIGKLSTRLGIATEQISTLNFAFEQTGVSASQGATALQRLQRRVSEAAQGSGEAVTALQELGLNAEKLTELPLDEQFKAVADAFQDVDSQGRKTALAMKLFDTEGVALIQTMEGGADAIESLQREAVDLGLALEESTVRQVEAANDALNKFTSGLQGVANQLLIAIAPALEGLGNFLTQTLIPGLQEGIRVVQAFGAAVTGFIVTTIDQAREKFQRFLSLIGVFDGEIEEAKNPLEEFRNIMESITAEQVRSQEATRNIARNTKRIAEAQQEAKSPSEIKEEAEAEKERARGLDQAATAAARLAEQQADLTRSTERRLEELDRLIQAARESDEALQRTNDIIGAENTLRQASVDLATQEGQRELENLLVIERKEDQLQNIIDTRAKAAAEAERIQREATQAATQELERQKRVISDVDRELDELIDTQQNDAVASLQKWRNETLSSVDAATDGYEEFARDVEEIYRRRLPQAQREFLETQTDVVSGVKRGLLDIQEEFNDFASLAESTVKKAFGGIEDALVDLVTTGKTDFKSLLRSIAADLTRLSVRNLITGPLSSALAGGTGGSSGSGSLLGGIGSLISGIFSQQGNVFSGGDLVEQFQNGGVVGSPLLFPLNRGQLGVAGEAGPEAILPLARNNSGDLGVQVAGGSGGGTFAPNVSISVNIDGSSGDPVQMGREIAEATGIFIIEQLREEQRIGGVLRSG